MIKLSSVQRVLMCGLVFMVNTFFRTHVSYAWIITSVNTANPEYFCTLQCPQAGYAAGIMGSALSTMVLGSTNLITANCYCLTQDEQYAIESCVAKSCGDVMTNGNGTGTGVYDLFNAFSYKPYGSCVPDQLKCGCKAGSAPYNGISCSTCNPGYYKAATMSMNAGNCSPCPEGRYVSTAAASTCVQCNPGYYAGGMGNSSCTPCSKGYWNAGYGKSSCNSCGIMNSAWFLLSANGAIISVLTGVGGTTDSTGATTQAKCYVSAMSYMQPMGAMGYFGGFSDDKGIKVNTAKCTYQ